MLLRPRKFKFKNRHKKRSYLLPRVNSLVYGQVGLKILQPIRLYSKQMFRFKLFIKKAARRSDKTSRKSWLIAFPHLPLTKKTSGSRMGKGKGKLKDWVCLMPAGVNLVEFKNLRTGRAFHFCKQISYKLTVKTRIIHSYKKIYNPYNLNKLRHFEVSW